MKASYRCFEVL